MLRENHNKKINVRQPHNTAICGEQVMVYFDVRYWHLPADTDNSLLLLHILCNDTVNR